MKHKKLVLAALFTLVFIIGAFTTVIGLVNIGRWMIGS